MTNFDRRAAAKLVAGILALLTALYAMLIGEPETKPQKPLPFERIASDDGNSHAWLINKGGEYTLDRDLAADESAIFVTASENVTLDLGGHTIEFGASGKIGCVGVNPLKAKSKHSGFGENDKRFAAALPDGSWRSRTLTIRNGTIRHTGPPESAYSCCIGGDYTFPIVIQNVTLDVGGTDAACVNGSTVTIEACRTVNRSRETTNRHQAPANIRATHLIARRNVIEGGNSGLFVGKGSANIIGNVIRNHAFVTNGYGVMLYRCEACEVADNLIVPTNGRGVLDNGPPDFLDRKPVTIRDNLIIVREAPNAEYGSGLQACCVRSRYQSDHLNVLGNRCLAFGGGPYTAGLGIYLTHAIGSESNVISGNEFAGVLLRDRDFSKNHWAAPMGLIGQGSFDAEPVECADVIRDNRLSTNDFAIAVSHTDGGCNQNVHCASVEFMYGRKIIERFAIYCDGWQGNPEAGKKIAAELRAIEITEPTARTWLYAGRWQGSRCNIEADSILGVGVGDVHFATSRYPFSASINGRQIERQ